MSPVPHPTATEDVSSGTMRRPLQSLSVNNAKFHHASGGATIAVGEPPKGELIKPQASAYKFAAAASSTSDATSRVEMPLQPVKHTTTTSTTTMTDQWHAIFRQSSSDGEAGDGTTISTEESRDSAEDVPEELLLEQNGFHDEWTLKRASPILEDGGDDFEEFTSYESPTKKAKVQNLHWENRISVDDPFDIASLLAAATTR